MNNFLYNDIFLRNTNDQNNKESFNDNAELREDFLFSNQNMILKGPNMFSPAVEPALPASKPNIFSKPNMIF